MPLSCTLRRLLVLKERPPCWVEDETARLRAMRRAFIVSCREEIAAVGSKELWLKPQIKKVPVSVLSDIGRLIQADAPNARQGKEVEWKHFWNTLDYFLGATLDQGEDVTDLAYFTDCCSFCFGGPGALKKCKGCGDKPCTHGQAGWPAYLHHFCVAKAAGSMADDLKHSHVCHSCLQTSCGDLLKKAETVQIARKKAGRDDERIKNLEFYCKEMGNPMPKLGTRCSAGNSGSGKSETIALWCERMRKYLLGSIKKPGSLLYYEGGAEQKLARERWANMQHIRIMYPMVPVPLWPLPDGAQRVATSSSSNADGTRVPAEAPGEGSGGTGGEARLEAAEEAAGTPEASLSPAVGKAAEAAASAHPSELANIRKTRLRAAASKKPLAEELEAGADEGGADEGIAQPDAEGEGQGEDGAEAPADEDEHGEEVRGWDEAVFENFMNLINNGGVLLMIADLAGDAP